MFGGRSSPESRPDGLLLMFIGGVIKLHQLDSTEIVVVSCKCALLAEVGKVVLDMGLWSYRL